MDINIVFNNHPEAEPLPERYIIDTYYQPVNNPYGIVDLPYLNTKIPLVGQTYPSNFADIHLSDMITINDIDPERVSLTGRKSGNAYSDKELRIFCEKLGIYNCKSRFDRAQAILRRLGNL